MVVAWEFCWRDLELLDSSVLIDSNPLSAPTFKDFGDVLDETCFKKDVYQMLLARRNCNVAEVPEKMQRLWVWFGLVCLEKASHKTWEWSHKDVRGNKLMNECVSVSDEALALQTLNVRGEGYVKAKKMKEAGVTSVGGGMRGRDKNLVNNVNLFCWYFEKVAEVRDAPGDKDDGRGWYSYLRDKQLSLSKRPSMQGGYKAYLDSFELPCDD